MQVAGYIILILDPPQPPLIRGGKSLLNSLTAPLNKGGKSLLNSLKPPLARGVGGIGFITSNLS